MDTTRIRIIKSGIGVGNIILCLLHFLHMQLIFYSLSMWYAFSLISIIIAKPLIDLFALVYLISIDWTSLRLSTRCVQKSSRDQLFSQPLRRLVLSPTILRKR